MQKKTSLYIITLMYRLSGAIWFKLSLFFMASCRGSLHFHTTIHPPISCYSPTIILRPSSHKYPIIPIFSALYLPIIPTISIWSVYHSNKSSYLIPAINQQPISYHSIYPLPNPTIHLQYKVSGMVYSIECTVYTFLYLPYYAAWTILSNLSRSN